MKYKKKMINSETRFFYYVFKIPVGTYKYIVPSTINILFCCFDYSILCSKK